MFSGGFFFGVVSAGALPAPSMAQAAPSFSNTSLVIFFGISVALSVAAFLMAGVTWITRRSPRARELSSLCDYLRQILAVSEQQLLKNPNSELELRSDIKFIKQDLSMIRELVFESLQREDEREARAAERRAEADARQPAEPPKLVRRSVPASRVANMSLAEFFTKSENE